MRQGLEQKDSRVLVSAAFAVDIVIGRLKFLAQLGQEIVGKIVVRPDEHAGDFVGLEKMESVGHGARIKIVIELTPIIGLVDIVGQRFKPGPGDVAFVAGKDRESRRFIIAKGAFSREKSGVFGLPHDLKLSLIHI